MASIRFEGLRVTEAQRIDVECVTGDSSVGLWFEFSEPVAISNDNVAAALTTLCGKTFSDVHFDFDTSDDALVHAKVMTGAKVTNTGKASAATTPRRGGLLSFSGGFDSLAALCLMPEDTALVSMDFGGRFARERSFFEKFPTTTVATNILETGLQRNSWSFMGSGAILLGDHHRAQYHTFGSILEAGPDNMRVSPVAARNNTFPPFKAAGYSNAPYVAGLTEIGTLLVMAHYRRDHIRESLSSLASPGEEKLYRKQVLTQVVSERLGVDIPIALSPEPPRPHFAFGQNFTLDLLSLYVTKYGDATTASELVSDIPDEVTSLAKNLDLTFFERANPTIYQHFPAPLLGGLADRLAQANISFYTETDWIEFRQVREVMAKFYPVVAT